MATEATAEAAVSVEVTNVGGIDETSVEFSPGITILSGRNATNRTSFLRALMAALGSDETSLKGDADEGGVELTIGDRTSTRKLRREGDTVVADGDPYLDDAADADLFAFLLESNEARRAVERGEDLRELIMRPIDVEELRADIDRLRARKRSIKDQLAELEELSGRLPALEERRTAVDRDLENKRESLEELREELAAAEAELAEKRSDRSELPDAFSTLRDRRSALEEVRYELETERETVDHLRDERDELRDELESLPSGKDGERDRLDTRLERLRERKRSLEEEIEDLQSIVRFNERMLDGTSTDVVAALRDDDEGALTDELLADDSTVACWTCGSEVQREQIESTLERLRDLRADKHDERKSIREEIDDLSGQLNELEAERSRRERVEARLESIESDVARRTDRIETLEDRRESLSDELADLEEAVEAETREEATEEETDIVDLHKEVNRLEVAIERLEETRAEVESEIDEIESELDERTALEAELEDVREALRDRRTQIQRIEQDAVDEFNDHMASILDLLDYANLERIWIERVDGNDRATDELGRGRFVLHVTRTTDSGAAYEDTIDHLSESEREVTGIVFALAGYLAHELYEDVPMMLLDSLEAIDAERIAALVEYVAQFADYLVVALLTEDAEALDDDYERITSI